MVQRQTHHPRVLLFNGSPRPHGHTDQLLQSAGRALTAIGIHDIQMCSLAGPESNFEAIVAAWRGADVLLVGAPVYIFGPPAQCSAFFNYLCKALSAEPDRSDALPKVVGLIAQGGGEYSGAEIAAQVLLQQVLAAGALPVSGYSPGASQGVIGQVSDQSGVPVQMEIACQNLALRVVEMYYILASGWHVASSALRLLGVVTADAYRPHVNRLLEAALAGAHEVGPVNVELFDFADRNVAPCLGCDQYCAASLECIYNDGMQEFRRRWLEADAVLWVVEAEYGAGLPGLRAAIDRMTQVRFETYMGLRQSHMARHLHASGVLAAGPSLQSVASTLQFFDHCAMLYQDVPVWEPGGCGFCLAARDVLPPAALERARSLGRRVARLAGALRAGVLANDLPDEYYPSCERLGQPDRARSRFYAL